MEEDLTLKKARFILADLVQVPEGASPPVRISNSTAGPGAGSSSIVISFNGMRVKKGISTAESLFKMSDDFDKVTVDGKDFLDVKVEPVCYHCPDQAFFNLDERCMYHCIYCASPLLDHNKAKSLTAERMVDMIRANGHVKAIAITSGVYESVQSTIDRMVECVRYLHNEFPELPIGVEPYVDDHEQIDALKDAGATEIKINCEAARKDIFMKVCPELDQDNIIDMLSYAVKIFGKGKVASNIIVGLGESDDDVTSLVKRLAELGITAGLRPLKLNGFVKEQFIEKMGYIAPNTPERLVDLAKKQKSIFENYGLSPKTFDTMCFRCTCCDILPFIDL